MRMERRKAEKNEQDRTEMRGRFSLEGVFRCGFSTYSLSEKNHSFLSKS